MPGEHAQQNIRVAVRCRPLNKYELERGALSCVHCARDKVTVRDRNTSKVFTFDQVFNAFSKQIDVYNAMVAPVVEEILMGYNCTIFAYGQTGSGKTFTMTGERSDKLRYAWEDDPLVGIIPRALSHLFHNLEQNGSDFSVRVSFLEVYNEELFDLLSLTETNRLTIYDDVNRKGSVIVKGLREVVVLDKDNVHSVIERGLARRQTASTLLNAQSSRSHSIFTVTVHIKETNPISGEELLRIGKLHLVDLAGSESIGRSGAIDKRAREAGSINQSLLTLGRVITALVDHTPHVPYRESKLTRLLQDSLGGRTKTSIIATISPSTLSLDETLSTLDYAHRAKNIENRPEVNVRLNKIDLVRSYNEELERMRRDLEAARTKNGIFVDLENYQTLQNQIKQQRERICELEERREIQENDMAQLQEMFTLTQAELSETRERQEKVENELLACQADLEEKRLRLVKLKFRLEEEEHLRQQHEKTENLLRDQATSLLTTTRVAVSDVGGLHDKVRRLTDLDKENRERIKRLPSTWAVERLSTPTADLTEVSRKVDVFCQQIRHALSDLRSNTESAVYELLRTQNELSEKLASCLATECIDAAEQTDAFSEEQLKLSKECLEITLRPQSKRITALHELLQANAGHLSLILARHNTAVNSSHERITSLIDDFVELSKQLAASIAIERKRNTEARQFWEHSCARQAAISQTLRSTLDRMDEHNKETGEFIENNFAIEGAQLSKWQDICSQSLVTFGQTLSEVNCEAITEYQQFHSSSLAALNQTNESLGTLSTEHDQLQQSVDLCLNHLCKQAAAFSTEGLGAVLRYRASQWKKPCADPDESDTEHASSKLSEFVGTIASGMTALSETTTAKALGVENMAGDVSYDTTLDFSKIKNSLNTVPADLDEQLKTDFQCYLPTGRTPQPKTFSYPENLVQTAPHNQIRRVFREVQLEKGLEQLALTPLPRDSFEAKRIGDSPVNPNEFQEIFGSPPSKSDPGSTSGVGSESAFSELLTDQPDHKNARIGDFLDERLSSAIHPNLIKSDPTTPVVQRPKPRKKAVELKK